MLRGCAFDLGNTLVNDAAAFEVAVAEMDSWLHGRGLIAAPGSFASTYSDVNRARNEPFISHTYGETSFFAETFERLGAASPEPDQALEVYRRILMNRLTLAPETAGALSWLRARGLKTALVTNESVARVDAFLAKTDGAALFDQVIVSQAVGHEKPDPAIFREVLARLDLRGPELVMLGDNEVADGACRGLGIRFVLVTGFKHAGWGWERGAAYEPDCVIERIDIPSLQRVLSLLDAGKRKNRNRNETIS